MAFLRWQNLKQSHRVALTAALVLGFLLLGFQNCAPAPEENDPEAEYTAQYMKEEIERRNVQLLMLSEANRSCVVDSDCIAIEVGHKTCGGPRAYTYSSIKNDVSLLNRYSTELKTLERQAQDPNTVGDCMVVQPPNLTCVANICQATN